MGLLDWAKSHAWDQESNPWPMELSWLIIQMPIAMAVLKHKYIAKGSTQYNKKNNLGVIFPPTCELENWIINENNHSNVGNEQDQRRRLHSWTASNPSQSNATILAAFRRKHKWCNKKPSNFFATCIHFILIWDTCINVPLGQHYRFLKFRLKNCVWDNRS